MSKEIRTVASEIIYAVKYEQGYINLALRNVDGIDKKDMGLLTNLVYGTVKNYEYLEALLLMKTDLMKSKRIVRVILVLALYQKMFLDKVPDYAIINAAVDSTRSKANQFAADFVNGFLRQNLSTLSEGHLTLDNDVDKRALEQSVPVWLYRMIVKQYSQEQAEFFFTQIKKTTPQFGRVNQLQTTKEKVLQDELFEAIDLPSAVIYHGGNIATTQAYLTGDVSVQNISSQKIAEVLAPQKGDVIWDMCAAPGGKSCHLAELIKNDGRIVATDLHEHRVKQINENIQRLGITSVETQAVDALNVSACGEYDKILLDAPCSGFGVMGQKPEIKYQILPENLDDLEQLQIKLLEKAYESLKPGGELVYSTCTINRKENEKQVEKFLNNHQDIECLSEKLFFSEMVEGYSGFYYAKMSKAK